MSFAIRCLCIIIAGVSIEAGGNGEHLPVVCCHQGPFTAGGATLLCTTAALLNASASTNYCCLLATAVLHTLRPLRSYTSGHTVLTLLLHHLNASCLSDQ